MRWVEFRDYALEVVEFMAPPLIVALFLLAVGLWFINP